MKFPDDDTFFWGGMFISASLLLGAAILEFIALAILSIKL